MLNAHKIARSINNPNLGCASILERGNVSAKASLQGKDKNSKRKGTWKISLGH